MSLQPPKEYLLPWRVKTAGGWPEVRSADGLLVAECLDDGVADFIVAAANATMDKAPDVDAERG